jgi:hypothetical protein
VGRDIKDASPSARKTSALYRNVGATYHSNRAVVTIHMSWLKRLWDHLTRRRQFSVAFLHFEGGRR